MHGESVVLTGSEDSAEGWLLFPPGEVSHVTNASGAVSYTAGVDYLIEPGSRRLTRVPGSAMPWANRETRADGRLTHDRTIAVTYTHADDPTVWAPAANPPATLPRVARRLECREPLTLCVTGDSISAGYDSSGFHGVPPFQPPFATLVASALERRSGAPVHLHNLATAGWTAADGLWDATRVAAADPDIVIVAFGMNDAAYASGDEFGGNVAELVTRIRAGRPDTEFVLVAPMLPTPECTWVDHARFAEYRERLAALTGEGIALADVTRLWNAMAARKDLHDLSGNGLNHPNDFGHRLYAQVILAALEAPGIGPR
jgi:lysophospholipase L1-like esterase